MHIPIVHNMICDAALAAIVANASKAPQPKPADGASGPILTDAMVFIQVLTELQGSGVSSSNILNLITTIIDLIKVAGPDVMKIVAEVTAILAGG